MLEKFLYNFIKTRLRWLSFGAVDQKKSPSVYVDYAWGFTISPTRSLMAGLLTFLPFQRPSHTDESIQWHTRLKGFPLILSKQAGSQRRARPGFSPGSRIMPYEAPSSCVSIFEVISTIWFSLSSHKNDNNLILPFFNLTVFTIRQNKEQYHNCYTNFQTPENR